MQKYLGAIPAAQSMLTEFAYVDVARVRDPVIASGVAELKMSHTVHMPPWWLVVGKNYFYVTVYIFSTSHGWSARPEFLNLRAAARNRALASIIPGHERFSWNLTF